jgi:hypothetical protein
MLVTADNQTLIVAESYANNLTAFDIEGDGSLSNRRVWAALGEGVPDGICLDDENAVWYGDVPNKRCVRVREGGEVLQTIELEQRRDTREADRSYAKSDPRHARRADADGRASTGARALSRKQLRITCRSSWRVASLHALAWVERCSTRAPRSATP